MKIKVLAIAPYPGLSKLIMEVASDFPEMEIVSYNADMEESLSILKKHENEQFDFILSRGGTAQLLEKYTDVPLIEIQVNGYDILRTLTLLKGYDPAIQMIGFENIIQSFEAVSTIINMAIIYTVVSQENDVHEALKAAKEKNVQIIVGDTITVRMAKSLGLQGVLITSGKEAVAESLNIIKKMHRHISITKQKNHFMSTLFDQMEDGLVILNNTGQIIKANERFYKMFQMKKQEDSKVSLFHEFPFFRRFIKKNQFSRSCKIEISLFNAQYVVTSGSLEDLTGTSELFFVKFTEMGETAQGYSICYPEISRHEFPQLITSGETFDRLVADSQKIVSQHQPLFIYGEPGSGRNLLVSYLYEEPNQRKGDFIEISIDTAVNLTLEPMLEKLKSEDASTFIHLVGFENLSIHQQKRFVSEMKHFNAQLIFSFSQKDAQSPEKFDKDLYKLFKSTAIYVPSLKERMEEFEQFVRSFIVHFNEQFGKQIVGVQPDAMNILKERKWTNNFYELKDSVKELVSFTSGEYIDLDSLSVLEKINADENKPEVAQLDLTQTLEEIEKQIIEIVLQEENMNQSKVAKRLNINRSTLWRKLKA